MLEWAMPNICYKSDQHLNDVDKDSELRAIVYMHIVLVIVYVVIAVLTVVTILIGLYLSHRKIIKATRPTPAECPQAVHNKMGRQ